VEELLEGGGEGGEGGGRLPAEAVVQLVGRLLREALEKREAGR